MMAGHDRHLPGAAPMRRACSPPLADAGALAPARPPPAQEHGTTAPRRRRGRRSRSASRPSTRRSSTCSPATRPLDQRQRAPCTTSPPTTARSAPARLGVGRQLQRAPFDARRRRRLLLHDPPVHARRRSTSTTCCCDAPAEPAAPGRPFPLHGRAALPAGHADRRSRPTRAPGFQPAGDGDRRGGRHVHAPTSCPRTTGAAARVVGRARASPAVQLLVLDRKLAATGGGHGRAVAASSARVTPGSGTAHRSCCSCACASASAGGRWPRAKLDHASHGALLAAPRRGATRRASCSRCADGATPLAVSRTLHVGPKA